MKAGSPLWQTHPNGIHLDRVVTAAQMREADAHTIEHIGIPGAALMEAAGRALAAVCHTLAPDAAVLVCAGTGNNGGDGFVAARYLQSWGHRVRVVVAGAKGRVRPGGDAERHLEALSRLPNPIEVTDETGLDERFDLAIDALLGTGLKGPARGPTETVIDWLNGPFTGVIVAADIPSGVDSDTGAAQGAAVRANATVTFGASKLGHWCYPGAGLRGALHVVDIGIPSARFESAGHLLGDDDLKAAFHRPRDGHKGTFGHVGVVGGSEGKLGAPRLSADAAMRAGAGLTTIDADPSVVAQLSGLVYEVMVAPFEWGTARRDARVIGPGLSADEATGDALRRYLKRDDRPTVLDADALNHCAADLTALRTRDNLVLTPHPGEAARLLNCTAAQVQADRPAALRALVEKSGNVVVLKGAHTLVSGPQSGIDVCPAGNPGLGTGGAGDVLAGIIGALLARGLAPIEAARAGVLWHARAGDAAAGRRAEGAVIARDVIDALGEVEAQHVRSQ